MFDTQMECVNPGRITRYSLTCNRSAITFADVLDLWQNSHPFRDYFTKLLAGSSFAAFRWETPALTHATANHWFGFVLVNAPEFTTRKTDPEPFRHHFTAHDADSGIVSFTNLSGDATLIVPSPRASIDAYGHLAAFIRNAPANQVDALWRVISTSARSQLGKKPLWLSTAGGGVAWLHVRLDSRPKYYGYSPYKTI